MASRAGLSESQPLKVVSTQNLEKNTVKSPSAAKLKITIPANVSRFSNKHKQGESDSQSEASEYVSEDWEASGDTEFEPGSENSQPQRFRELENRPPAYDLPQLSSVIINSLNLSGGKDLRSRCFRIFSTLDILMGHHLLMRGEMTRNTNLSDTYLSKSRWGPTPLTRQEVPLLRVVIDKSYPEKAVACARNRRPERCLMGMYALSLWHRFDFDDGGLDGINLPDFKPQQEWNELKVLAMDQGKDLSKKLVSSFRQCRAIKSAFECIGINAITATCRATSLAIAKRNQVYAPDIKGFPYVNGLPMDFLCSHAGFASDEPYLIKRAAFKPSKELRRKIFPWLESRKISVMKYIDKRPENSDPRVVKFLEMLDQLRDIILQDLPYIREIAPKSIYGKHQINDDPLFNLFAKEVLSNPDQTYEDNLSNDIVQIEESGIFEVSKEMEISNESRVFEENQVQTILDNQEQKFRAVLDNQQLMFEHQEKQFKTMLKKQKHLFKTVLKNQQLLFESLEQQMYDEKKENTERYQEIMTLIQPSNSSPGVSVPKTPYKESQETQAKILGTQNLKVLKPINVNGSKEKRKRSFDQQDIDKLIHPQSWELLTVTQIAELRMNRKTERVDSLLIEWFIGTETMIPVVEKDKRYGTGWRDSVETNFYSKRKKVIVSIVRMYESRPQSLKSMSLVQYGGLLEKVRCRRNITLLKLGEVLLNPSFREIILNDIITTN